MAEAAACIVQGAGGCGTGWQRQCPHLCKDGVDTLQGWDGWERRHALQCAADMGALLDYHLLKHLDGSQSAAMSFWGIRSIAHDALHASDTVLAAPDLHDTAA